jgi:hypothetical protein
MRSLAAGDWAKPSAEPRNPQLALLQSIENGYIEQILDFQIRAK